MNGIGNRKLSDKKATPGGIGSVKRLDTINEGEDESILFNRSKLGCWLYREYVFVTESCVFVGCNRVWIEKLEGFDGTDPSP